MDFIQKQPGLSVIVAFIVGLVIGLPVLGWGLWPVEWTDAAPEALAQADRDNYLTTIADLYSADGDAQNVQSSLSSWSNSVAAICDTKTRSIDPAEQARLENIASVVNGAGCGSVIDPDPADSSTNLLPILGMGILLLVFVAGIFYVVQRRNALMEEVDVGSIAVAIPSSAPVIGGDEDVVATPLARFQSTYTYGRDTYDDSFSIEGENGDFLGECGIGISESIGTDTPKNVTAFEVWLFDKNDIRTVTKVIMSDHAFFDEAMKAKLAPKGEPVLAQENEVVILETATLIINAEIKAMEYGSGTLPPQSYMESFTVELSAWSKDGDFSEPDVPDHVDEILDY